MSVPDLKQNSQDTSAFYLANIYQILTDPNVIIPRTPTPSTMAIPASFSPPRYALGEFALVLELSDQSHMRPLCDVAVSMGTSIHQVH